MCSLSLKEQIVFSVCTFYSLKYALPWNKIISIQTNWFNDFIASQQNILCLVYFSFILLKLSAIGFQWSTFYFTYKKYTVKPLCSYVASRYDDIVRQMNNLESDADVAEIIK